MTFPWNRRRFLQTAGLATAALALGKAEHAAVAAEATPEKKKWPYPFQLGLASFTTRSLSLEKTLEICQRLDLKQLCLKSGHLPLDASPEKIAAVAQQVQAAGVVLYGCGVVYMKTAEEVARTFAYAKAAGIRTIVGVPAPALLPLVQDKVQEYDIAVAIHNHGPTDKVYPLPGTAYELIKTLDPRIGLCIDIGHTVRAGEDLPAVVERYADRLLDFHVKDVSTATPEGDTIAIGHGVIDIAAFFRALLKVKYSRVVSFEYEKDNQDPLPGLAESVGYVQGVLATLAP